MLSLKIGVLETKKFTNMKYVVLIIALLAFSCSEDEPETNQGCLTGIPKGTNDRVLIRCSTNQEFLAGDNTSHGGTASWTQYTGHQWAKCDDCK